MEEEIDLEGMFEKETGKEWCRSPDYEYIEWLEEKLEEKINLFKLLSTNIKTALNASVSAIYFGESSDFRSYHYEVIYALTGIDKNTEINISKLYNELNK